MSVGNQARTVMSGTLAARPGSRPLLRDPHEEAVPLPPRGALSDDVLEAAGRVLVRPAPRRLLTAGGVPIRRGEMSHPGRPLLPAQAPHTPAPHVRRSRVPFRIVLDPTGDAATLRLSGSLDAEGLVVLQEECRACRRPLGLDLSQLRGIDDVGAAYLRGLVDGGVRIVGANPNVSVLLHLGDTASRGPEAPGTP